MLLFGLVFVSLVLLQQQCLSAEITHGIKKRQQPAFVQQPSAQGIIELYTLKQHTNENEKHTLPFVTSEAA